MIKHAIIKLLKTMNRLIVQKFQEQRTILFVTTQQEEALTTNLKSDQTLKS